MEEVRWGIIGCGDVTEVKSGPAFQNVSGSRLVAVMRRDGVKAADYAKRHNVPRWYGEAEKLINDPEVDAVYVATPPGSHEEYAIRIAAAGKPCYVEKPMARSYAECVRMVEAFRAKKLPLFVAYYRRRLPRFLKVKELIDAGQLGRITGVTYRHARLFRPDAPYEWRLDPIHSGGGLLLDLGSHLLDLLDFLLGPLQEVSGTAANMSGRAVEDVVAMHFKTGNQGAPGVATWNFAASHRQDVIEIEGTEGRLVFTCFGNDPVRFEKPGHSVETFDLPNPVTIQQPFIQCMVDELLGRGGVKCPSTGESGARTSQVMDTVLTGFYGDRSRPFWPL